MNQFPRSTLGPLEFFQKFAEIFAAQCATPVSLTPAANGKIFNQKSFKYLVWRPWSWHIDKFFFSSSLQVGSSLILFPLFTTGAIDTGGNLPPVSMTPAIQVAIFCQCCWYQWQICQWCSWHREQFCHICHWYRWCTLTCEYLCKFL